MHRICRLCRYRRYRRYRRCYPPLGAAAAAAAAPEHAQQSRQEHALRLPLHQHPGATAGSAQALDPDTTRVCVVGLRGVD